MLERRCRLLQRGPVLDPFWPLDAGKKEVKMDRRKGEDGSCEAARGKKKKVLRCSGKLHVPFVGCSSVVLGTFVVGNGSGSANHVQQLVAIEVDLR